MSVPNARTARLVPLLLALLFGLVLVTGAPATPAQAASSASRVKTLISKIIKSKHPKKTYYALPKKDRALVYKEVKNGSIKLRIIKSTPSNSVSPNSGSTTRCWQKTLESSYYGGVTRSRLFSTTNTTNVCVSGGSVSLVNLPQRFQSAFWIGWQPDGVDKATFNAGWEGRGAALGKFSWGAAGWYPWHKTLCAQLRLNRDFVHYGWSSDCTVYP